MIITCFYLNTNYELNKKWESGIRGIIMFMIIMFMIIMFMIIMFMIIMFMIIMFMIIMFMIIMFMIIIFMIKSEIKFCVEFSFGYIFL